ncbi:MAG: SpoIIE family protein phosphatase, partial [Bacteroidota bacterium]|nr:SpoIIE family protein phosphatase [Bacteroidota bacterium]
GAFYFKNNKLTKITTPIDSIISNNTYRVIDIKNKYFGFQLYNGGFLITDKNFNIIRFLKSPDILNNDKIYRSFIDNQDNIWFCTDYGIASVYLFSPFSFFGSSYGFDNESTCFDAILFQDKLFTATASGIFLKNWHKTENKLNPKSFVRVNNANIKTQNLDTIQSNLFAATSSNFSKIIPITNDSTSLKYQAEQILKKRAIKAFTMTNTNSNTVVGISRAIFIFKKINNKWKYIKDFQNFSGTHIVQDNKNYFWISDPLSGIYKIKFDSDYENILDSTIFSATDNTLSGLPNEKKIRIFKLNNDVIFTTKKGIFKFNHNTNKFFLDTLLNNIIGKKNIIFIYKDNKDNIWLKEQIDENNTSTWKLRELLKTDTGYTLISKPFLFLKNNIFSFSQISDYEYIIGSSIGFIHYDNSIPLPEEKQFPAFIRSVKIFGTDSIIFAGTFVDKDSVILYQQSPSSIPELKYKYGNLRFTFSGSFYQSPNKIQYTFFLEGNDEKWSDWTDENYIDYSNLKPGSYTFWVKAKNEFDTISTISKYSFVIKPPWYFTILAIIMYFIFGALLIWLIVYLYTRRLRMQKINLENLVKQRTHEIEQQKHEIETQRDQLSDKNEEIQKINKDITSSIEYAKRIQTAMLPLKENINEHLKDYFILFKPRDIVSGDFYWFTHKNDKTYISAVDCTGHGVPGAFMSMIGAEMLTTIVNNKEIEDPAEILEHQNKYVRKALKQDATENQDGMDMALCVIDKKNKVLEFSGAKNPLFIIKDGELTKIRGNKQSIGGYQFDSFIKHTINYKSPTWFYIFSDGYADQFGGPTEKAEKFMIKKFKAILLDIYQKPMNEQKEILDKEIKEWMKNARQTDDIIVIGFKL